MLRLEVYLTCLEAMSRLGRDHLLDYGSINLDKGARFLYEQATGEVYNSSKALEQLDIGFESHHA